LTSRLEIEDDVLIWFLKVFCQLLLPVLIMRGATAAGRDCSARGLPRGGRAAHCEAPVGVINDFTLARHKNVLGAV